MNILMPIYSCNPEGESESLVGYNWLEQISRHHKVFLITELRYKKALEARLTKNVVFNYVSVPHFGDVEIFSGFPPAYFIFMLKAYIVARRIIKHENINLIHRITPTAFRFPDIITNINLPYVIGPVGGGLKPPEYFRSVFRKENPVYILRALDSIRFIIDPFLIGTYNKTKRILVVGKYLYSIFPERYHKKMEVYCENTIDSKKYKMILNRDNKKIKLLYVGRFIPFKAVNLLIRALKLLKDENSEIEYYLTLIGGGEEYFEYCKVLANDLGVSSNLEFLGRIRREEIVEFYQTCDIFCFPSLKETSGNVLLEAMSCGIPVIVADRGGPAELVDMNCGIKIPVTGEDDFVVRLKDAIVLLARDKELRYFYAVNARKRIEQLYDNNSIGERITKIYEDALAHE